MKKTNTGVICGLHRSGTTYIGRILSLSHSTSVIYEPFNDVWGLEYAPPRYTYWRAEDASSYAEEILQKALLFQGSFSKPVSTKSGWRKTGYKLFGGERHLQWNRLKLLQFLRMTPDHVIWKDPFCTFMIDYLSIIYNMKIVCMIRHPCAHYHSVSKQNWSFDISNLTRQKKLLNDYGFGISEHLWEKAKGDNLTSTALLWKIMSRLVTSISKKDNNLLLVRHEDLCMKPEAEIDHICKWLGVCFTSRMRSYVDTTSHGLYAESLNGKEHDFVRNSKALVDVWKSKVPKEKQNIILDIIGEDIKPFYTRNDKTIMDKEAINGNVSV